MENTTSLEFRWAPAPVLATWSSDRDREKQNQDQTAAPCDGADIGNSTAPNNNNHISLASSQTDDLYED